TRLASALLGDSMPANVFMLGFAFQRGLLPLSGQSLYRALELYGVKVANNKQTFDWGRYMAENPEEAEQMAGGMDRTEPASRTLPEIVARRAAFLEEYQNRAYADRYRRRGEQIAALEQRLSPPTAGLQW